MTRLEGDERFLLPAEVVAKKLMDVSFLVGCVPEIRIVEVTAERALFDVPSRVASTPGQVRVELMVMGRESHRAAFQIVSRATGASTSVSAVLTFSTIDGGTRVRWLAELERVTGLLRIMPRSVMHGAMQRVIGNVWERIQKRMEAI